MNIGFVSLLDAGWSSADDIGALQPGDHDPKVRGFTLPNTELTFDGAVDPYFKGFANIVYLSRLRGNVFYDYSKVKSLRTGTQFNFSTLGTELARQLTDSGVTDSPT